MEQRVLPTAFDAERVPVRFAEGARGEEFRGRGGATSEIGVEARWPGRRRSDPGALRRSAGSRPRAADPGGDLTRWSTLRGFAGAGSGCARAAPGGYGPQGRRLTSTTTRIRAAASRLRCPRQHWLWPRRPAGWRAGAYERTASRPGRSPRSDGTASALVEASGRAHHRHDRPRVFPWACVETHDSFVGGIETTTV